MCQCPIFCWNCFFHHHHKRAETIDDACRPPTRLKVIYKNWGSSDASSLFAHRPTFPIGVSSMGLVYLPTFITNNPPNVCKFAIEMIVINGCFVSFCHQNQTWHFASHSFSKPSFQSYLKQFSRGVSGRPPTTSSHVIWKTAGILYVFRKG